jgi:uncharacterized protein YjiS (DUF1127 family)
MTMIELTDVYARPPTLRLAIGIPDFLRTFLRRRRARRLLARLSRLSPHLIRDIGLDPDEVHDAVAGTWDEVIPGRCRLR